MSKETAPRDPLGCTESVAAKAMTAPDAGVYVAALIGLSEPLSAQAIWRLARVEDLPSVRLGRRVYFRKDAVDRWIERGGSVRRIG